MEQVAKESGYLIVSVQRAINDVKKIRKTKKSIKENHMYVDYPKNCASVSV